MLLCDAGVLFVPVNEVLRVLIVSVLDFLACFEKRFFRSLVKFFVGHSSTHSKSCSSSSVMWVKICPCARYSLSAVVISSRTVFLSSRQRFTASSHCLECSARTRLVSLPFSLALTAHLEDCSSVFVCCSVLLNIREDHLYSVKR